MRLLCNDLVIKEESCNLSCNYCLTGQSNLKASHGDHLIFDPPRRESLNDPGLIARLLTILDRFDALYEPAMLKITGGEVFLIPEITTFIDECAKRYKRLLVQTNGVVASDRQIASMARHDNIVIQVSLDSHLHHGNSYRVRDAGQHGKVLERIERFFVSPLPIEVYCVINDRSIETLLQFAHYLADREHPPQLTPFPVRGPDAQMYAPRPEQLGHLRAFATGVAALPEVAPPRAYLDRLVSFYAAGQRTFACHLPKLVASTFDDGMLTPCPNIWFSDAGNLTQAGWHEAGTRMERSGIRKALLEKSPRLSACKGCLTPWDTLSMYMDGELGLDQLCRSHAYRGLEGEVERFKADTR
ncbi:radical SAM protein [Sphingomonas sp. DG1-23]|uniref:radical SAM protein n=1 Tax=Sphingomonas sp. DG1-23 TaxID=3068316 RepID=UPI00273F7C12|nr:radical SAM protein [Sphingomonas sp. DG1-23]MDP5278670.1 radical SAM protein [Sphingomonas sp. DG1-23]